MINVKIKKLNQNAILPKYATSGSAACDLYSANDEDIIINPQETVQIPTGLAIDFMSNEIVALVFPRSGLATKHGISLANCVGVIDSDYRGEIKIALTNNSKTPYTIPKNERIAQLMFAPIYLANFIETDNLSETERGTGGFGSTGTN